ncbi:MAG: hypothetical protein MI919_13560, partial [Holophagales bacterium]|nr:hypothetical protein [Holophagales bacterium]
PRPLAGFLLSLAAGLVLPLAASAATATVGNDGWCTHLTLGSAVAAVEAADDGPHEIWILTGEHPGNEAITIRESMAIRGGLVSCLDSSPGEQQTEIRVSDNGSGPFLRVVGSGPGEPAVLLKNLRLTADAMGGQPAISAEGALELVLDDVRIEDMPARGLVASGASPSSSKVVVRGGRWERNVDAIRCRESTLQLEDTTFSHNRRGTAGAGGAITSENCRISVSDSFLSANSTEDRGGALRCVGGSLFLEKSSLRSNVAEDGGAISATDCYLTFGADVQLQLNRAARRGGALELTASDLRTTGPEYSWTGNTAPDGAFLWSAASTVSLGNALVGGDFFGGDG